MSTRNWRCARCSQSAGSCHCCVFTTCDNRGETRVEGHCSRDPQHSIQGRLCASHEIDVFIRHRGPAHCAICFPTPEAVATELETPRNLTDPARFALIRRR